MSEKCRLCLKQDGHLMKIFNNNVDNEIHSNIMACIGISIREDDGITNLICAQCFYNVKSFSELRTAAIKNDIRLKDELAEKRRNGTEPKEKTIPTQEPIKAEKVTPQKPPPETIIKKTQSNSKNTEKLINPISFPKATNETTTNEQSVTIETQTTFMSQLQLEKNPPGISSSLEKPKTQRKPPNYHPSVNRIRKECPRIKIPRKCLKWDFNPRVIVNRKIVEDWRDNLNKNKVWTVSASDGAPLSISLTRVTENKTCDNESVSSTTTEVSDGEAKDDNDDDLTDTDFDPVRQIHVNWSNKSRKRSNKSRQRQQAAKRAKRISSYSDNDSHNNASELTALSSDNQSETSHNHSQNQTNEAKTVEVMKQMINEFLPTKDNANVTKTNDTFTHLPNHNDSQPIEDLLVPTSNSDKTFICQTCSLVFDSLKLLKEHKKQHPKDNLRCQSCSKSFPLVEDLMKHNRAVHSKPTQPSVVKKTARKSTNTQKFKSILKTNFNTIKNKGEATQKDGEPLKEPLQQKTNEEEVIERIKKCLPVERKKVPPESGQHRFKPVNPGRVKEKTKDSSEKQVATTSTVTVDSAIVVSDDESPQKQIPTLLVQTTQVETPNPLDGVPDIPNEDQYFAELYLKHKNREVGIKKPNYSGNVVLQNVDKILERSYIPVELVPKSDGNNNHMTLRYISGANRNKTRPKNTSYGWSSQKAVRVAQTVRDNQVPVIQIPETSVQSVSVNPARPVLYNYQNLVQQNQFRPNQGVRSIPPVVPTNSYATVIPETNPPSYESSVLSNQLYSAQSVLNSSSVANIRTTQPSGVSNQLVVSPSTSSSNNENSNPMLVPRLNQPQTIQGIRVSECLKNNFSNLLGLAMSSQQNQPNQLMQPNLNPQMHLPQSNQLYQPNSESSSNIREACLYQANNQQSNISVQNFQITIVPNSEPTSTHINQNESIEQRPALRIKNISELMANAKDRNEIQNVYTKSVTDYFNTVQPQMQPNISDEYLQI